MVGYKTDEYNFVEQRYWVRQSHAHTWVEAYLPSRSDSARGPAGRHPVRLVTRRLAAAGPDPLGSGRADLGRVRQGDPRKWQTSIRTAWLQHVVQMSGDRQESLFYRPLIQALRDAMSRIATGNWGGAGASPERREVETSPWQWITSPLLLAASSLLVGSSLLAVLALRRRRTAPAPRCNAPTRPESRTAGSRAVTEFYRRWESVLDQWGLRRRPAQTPFEFAHEAGRQLAEAAEQPQLRPPPCNWSKCSTESASANGNWTSTRPPWPKKR